MPPFYFRKELFIVNKEWLKKNRFRIIFFTFIFLLINYTSYYFRSYGGDLLLKFTYVSKNPSVLLSAFPLSLNSKDLMFSFLGLGMSILVVLNNQSNKKTFRQGIEHGSAEWGKPNKDLKGMYNEKDEFKNVIFSQDTKLAINNSDVSHPTLERNKNAIIVGGSGSGKTRFFVKPNIMQMNSDYVITDPKGDILNELGWLLRAKKDYNIQVLNLIEFDKSMRYNPLSYIKEEQDILKVIETFIKNTQGKDAKDDFWVSTEKLLYQALIGAILEFFDPEEQHLGTLADLIGMFEVKENDEDYESVIDEMFKEIEEYNSNSFAVRQYRNFKIAAGETAKSILISCATRLAPINIPAVRDLLSSNEIEFDRLGNDEVVDDKGNIVYDENGKVKYRPNALFIIIPDTDTTFNFIASMLYTQMFNTIVTISDTKYGSKGLPRHVRFLLDEFANIGEIPKFEKLIATIRSRNMSATPILQTLSQLKGLYKEESETIVGNCDTLVFLGGKETSTLEMISKQLGKQTIDDYNTSRTRSQSDSYGQNYSKLGRELLTPDELQKLDRSKCVVMITNLPPFLDNKYDITKHPNYKYHGKSPEIDLRTGKIIKKGKHWFDTDKYINNYRTIYNYKIQELDQEEDLVDNKYIEENMIEEIESNLEQEVLDQEEEKIKNRKVIVEDLNNIIIKSNNGNIPLFTNKNDVNSPKKQQKSM